MGHRCLVNFPADKSRSGRIDRFPVFEAFEFRGSEDVRKRRDQARNPHRHI